MYIPCLMKNTLSSVGRVDQEQSWLYNQYSLKDTGVYLSRKWLSKRPPLNRLYNLGGRKYISPLHIPDKLPWVHLCKGRHTKDLRQNWQVELFFSFCMLFEKIPFSHFVVIVTMETKIINGSVAKILQVCFSLMENAETVLISNSTIICGMIDNPYTISIMPMPRISMN